MEFATDRMPAGVRFDAGEVTGATGDSVTVLPIVVALSLLTPVSLPHTLVGFGVLRIVRGLWYGLPLSVEPMKAIAGLAIAGGIGHGELVAAGALAGATLLVAGRTGAIGRLERAVGEPVVRGIQLAVALLLAVAGVELAVGDPVVAAGAALLTVAAAAAGHGRASALAVLAAGGLAAAHAGGLSAPTLPEPTPFPGGGPSATPGALEAAAGQLAMTVGNAAVATALLCEDPFDRELSSDHLATSMGVMTLAALPAGGLPMCHGSGGLAGKHAFGARTGGANVLLDVGYLGLALVAGAVVDALRRKADVAGGRGADVTTAADWGDLFDRAAAATAGAGFDEDTIRDALAGRRETDPDDDGTGAAPEPREPGPERVVADADVLAADLLVGGAARRAVESVWRHRWTTLVASDRLLAEARALIADVADPDLGRDWRARVEDWREPVAHPAGDHPALASAYRGGAMHVLALDGRLTTADAGAALRGRFEVSVREPAAFAAVFDPASLYPTVVGGDYPGPDRESRG